MLRGLAARATTPLLPDDYLKLLNPLWTARELRGQIVDVRPETADSATVTIKPGWGFSGDYRPGQYVGIGLRRRRPVALAVVLADRRFPSAGDENITITVKATPEGFLSAHLVNGVEPGHHIGLGHRPRATSRCRTLPRGETSVLSLPAVASHLVMAHALRSLPDPQVSFPTSFMCTAGRIAGCGDF